MITHQIKINPGLVYKIHLFIKIHCEPTLITNRWTYFMHLHERLERAD